MVLIWNTVAPSFFNVPSFASHLDYVYSDFLELYRICLSFELKVPAFSLRLFLTSTTSSPCFLCFPFICLSCQLVFPQILSFTCHFNQMSSNCLYVPPFSCHFNNIYSNFLQVPFVSTKFTPISSRCLLCQPNLL